MRSTKRKSVKWVDPYLGDFTEIAHAIELSADTIGSKLSDNRSRLGSLCARLVAECVLEVQRARQLWAHYFRPYDRPVPRPKRSEVKRFSGKTQNELIKEISLARERNWSIDDYLRAFCMQAECGTERLHFLLLPDLTKETAARWWKGAIEKMVEDRFPKLLQTPRWHKELKDASTGTERDMRKELKDYCRDKVKQFV